MRSLIERIDVRPVEHGIELTLTGALTQMLSLSAGTGQLLREPYSSSVKVVPGTCNHRQYEVSALV